MLAAHLGHGGDGVFHGHDTLVTHQPSGIDCFGNQTHVLLGVSRYVEERMLAWLSVVAGDGLVTDKMTAVDQFGIDRELPALVDLLLNVPYHSLDGRQFYIERRMVSSTSHVHTVAQLIATSKITYHVERSPVLDRHIDDHQFHGSGVWSGREWGAHATHLAQQHLSIQHGHERERKWVDVQTCSNSWEDQRE